MLYVTPTPSTSVTTLTPGVHLDQVTRPTNCCRTRHTHTHHPWTTRFWPESHTQTMWRRKVIRSSLSMWPGYEASLVARPHPHNGMRQGSNGVLYAMSTLLESCTRIHCSLDKVDCRNVVSSWYTTHMHTQSISICVCTPIREFQFWSRRGKGIWLQYDIPPDSTGV